MTGAADSLDQQLWDFVYAYDAAYDRAAQSSGLSAAQACLLDHLTGGSQSMGELAGALLCDASNVTQLAARLEARDLVTRVPDPADRRVKRVSITPAGQHVRDTVWRAFAFSSQGLRRLTTQEQSQLSALLAKVLAPECPDGSDPV